MVRLVDQFIDQRDSEGLGTGADPGLSKGGAPSELKLLVFRGVWGLAPPESFEKFECLKWPFPAF